MIVQSELEKLDIKVSSVELAVAETPDVVSKEKMKLLNDNLKKFGLELIESRKEIITERIKTAIIELVHHSDEPLRVNLSDYLSEKLNYDYTYLSNVFNEMTGSSIGKFFIAHRIERVKELIVYDELNLKEISLLTQFSSIAHLSNQFKKITGLAPSEYRNLRSRSRFSIEQLSV